MQKKKVLKDIITPMVYLNMKIGYVYPTNEDKNYSNFIIIVSYKEDILVKSQPLINY